MPFYHKLGKLPRKPHTVFYKDDGKKLYREELFSTRGFSGIFTNKYHIHMPTRVKSATHLDLKEAPVWEEAPLLYYHFFTDRKKTPGNFITARNLFMRNNHTKIATANPTENTEDFYRNAFATEYIFIHHGTGKLLSEYGQLDFVEGDQILIPRGTTYQLVFDKLEGNKIFIVESDTPFELPDHYKNEHGQLLEGAPLCERDIKLPEYLEPVDREGDFRLIIKAWDKAYEYIIPHHPFDVVGWDGYNYPHAFNIRDYAPKVGRYHLPPPAHLLYLTKNFVLCNFCPRPYDFDEQAIPAPYFHSNIDSDEIIYYAEGDFMSRKGIEEGSITLHPGGMPHGPQPGKTEASIGKKGTNEYAVMVDTFTPLYVTTNVKDTIDPNYANSWLDEDAS